MSNLEELVNSISTEKLKNTYTPYCELIERWCEENNKFVFDRLVLKSDSKEEIQKAFAHCRPDLLKKEVYKFPIGNYYWCTDKGVRFTVLKKSRGYKEKEKNKINDKKSSIETLKNELSRITDDTSIDEFKKKCKIKQLNVKLREQIEDLEDYLDEVETKRKKHSVFWVRISKSSNHYKLYMSDKNINVLKNLGYKIYESDRNFSEFKSGDNYFDLEILNWTNDSNEEKQMKYVQITSDLFFSCCANKIVPKFGQIINDNGQVKKYNRGRQSLQFTLKNDDELLVFDSMTDFAKHFDLDKGNASRMFKNKVVNDVIKVKKKKYVIVEMTT